MAFSFEDFLLYTKAPKADIKIFSAIAPGVLTYVEDTYGIILENNPSKSIQYFLRASGTTIDLPIFPVNSVVSITYASLAQDFTFYGEDIQLVSSITDIRKPVTIVADVGYTTVPNDLKLAVYQHIESLYFRAINSTDNIEKVINTAGNTTYFREDYIPKLSRDTYNKYSNRLIAFY